MRGTVLLGFGALAALSHVDAAAAQSSVDLPEGGGLYYTDYGGYISLNISGKGGLYLTNTYPNFSFTGPPRFNLSGTDNSYTGPTQILGDILMVRGGGAIGDFSAVTVANAFGYNFVSEGELWIGNAETIGSLDGKGIVQLEAALTTGGNGLSTTYAGWIRGGGGLTKVGSGTFTLTGANTYGGGTFVSGGTLVGNAGSIPGAISNAATVVFDQAADATFAGNVAALGGVAGQMVKQGAGTLTLSGMSTLPWTVQAGRLVSASDRFSGNLALAAGTSFTFDQSYNGTYAGEITGAGDLTFSGGGLVLLTGESTGHTGTSAVSGSLSVNGIHSGSVAVVSGGTLQGSGIVGNTTIGSGGALAPGNSIGTLTVRQALTMAKGSTYRAEIEPGGTADLVKVAGTAVLDGATVEVRRDPHGDPAKAQSFRHGQTYTILEAGSINGAFSPEVRLASAFLDASLATGAHDVTLRLAPKTAGLLFPTVAATTNQRHTATALDRLGQTAGSAPLNLYNAILFLGAEDARASFDALSGEIHASAKTGQIEDTRFLNKAAIDRLDADFAVARDPASDPAEGSVTLASTGIEAWLSGYGAWGETDGNGNAAPLDREIGGLLVGADGFLTETLRVGLLAGYSTASYDAGGRGSSAEVDSTHVGIYAGTRMGPVDLKAGASYSFNGLDTSRSIAFGSFRDSLSVNYESGTAQVFGEASYRIDTGVGTSISPFANLAYVSLDTDGFVEDGGAAALASAGDTLETIFSTVGLKGRASLPIGILPVSVNATLGWRHAEGDTVPDAPLHFAGAAPFAVEGAPIDRDVGIVDVGLGIALDAQSNLSVSYNGQIGCDTVQNGISAKLAIAF